MKERDYTDHGQFDETIVEKNLYNRDILFVKEKKKKLLL